MYVEFMREEVMHDLVNNQIDADCKQLDSKLCDLIYSLVALIFCYIPRSEPDQKLSSHFLICKKSI